MRVVIRDRTPEEIRRETARCGLSLSPEEWIGLTGRLQRDLSLAEAFLLDVALSEHCSYKSSKPLLKKHLPTRASHVILGPVEDAGVVSLGTWKGEEWALVVAHESHNHPSQVLPIEGAATGVGGIVRDVYCMGCDVAGVLDPLRFGPPDGPQGERTRALIRGVVRGIGEYGNALGVPNLGGDLCFHEGFEDNCLVNVVAFGAMRRSRLLRSRVPQEARREPYVCILVGKPTDATGLGGASFASQVLDESEAHENRGAVQVHDPFLKRMLVAAMREVWDLLEHDAIAAGCKDLGAGGLGGASSELAISGGMGLELDLDRVPVGVEHPEPHQILCAETQERFVWAVPESRAEEICAIFNERYELGRTYPGAGAVVVGRFLETPRFRCLWRGEIEVDLPNAVLEDSPIEERPRAPRSRQPEALDPERPADWTRWASEQLTAWNAVLRAPVYHTYDQEVRGEAYLRPGEADAGICRPVPGCPWGVAVSTDGNPDYGALDPYWAGALAVLESARNVAASGAVPLAVTDCLNFGNPEDPVCLGDFESALRGMSDACHALGSPGRPDEPLPIVSGNVSFYNQSSRGTAIAPSPIVACFGRIDDYGRALTSFFREPGHDLVLVGVRAREWGRPRRERAGGRVPRRPIAVQAAEIRAVLGCARDDLLEAAHDISDGGLLRTVFEMSVREEGPTSVTAELLAGPEFCIEDAEARPRAPHEILLSESPGFVLEVDPAHTGEVCRRIAAEGGFAARCGVTRAGATLSIHEPGGPLFDLDLSEVHPRWAGLLETVLQSGRSDLPAGDEVRASGAAGREVRNAGEGTRK